MTYFLIFAILAALAIGLAIHGALVRITNGIAVYVTAWLVWLEHSDDPETLREKVQEIRAAIGVEEPQS